MVECGTIDQPPSFEKITVWGIVTFICMIIVGLSSLFGLVNALNGFSLWDIIGIVGCVFGVAGLVFIILSIVKKNPLWMKFGFFCFLVSCLISIVLLILTIVNIKGDNENKFNTFLSCSLQIAFNAFLCYLFFLQSKGFTPADAEQLIKK